MQSRLLLPFMAMWLLLLAFVSGCAGAYEYRLPKAATAEVPAYGGAPVSGAADVDHDAVRDVRGEPMLEMDESSVAGERARFLPPPPPAPVFAKNGGQFKKNGGKGGEAGPPGHDAHDRKPADGTKEAPSAVDSPQSLPTTPLKDVKPLDPAVQAVPITAPLLIYNATVTMAVFEVKAAIDATLKLARDMGGYLVRRDDQTIVVRVPAAKYREALDAMGKFGDVLHREESVQDVTDEFLDMQTRLQNARALRGRLEQLLAQAKNVEEALMVERELARVTEQIERMEGRLKLLRELVAFSTITIEFRPRPVDQVQSNIRLPFEWLDQLGLSELLSL